MTKSRYPCLYQVNSRAWLTEFSRELGRRATWDDVPDRQLDEFAQRGFDWIWLLSVWQTGWQARAISRTNGQWRREFQETLPDLREEDIGGSGFAVTAYTVQGDQGGADALARLRGRLAERGLKLMLDFVPNHMGLGHPWIDAHPEYFIAGSEADLAREPQNYLRVKCADSERIFAHGRDPYFPGWPDTLQLDWSNPKLQDAMLAELQSIAGQCDGVRCDMAMLILPEVFERTWGRRAPLFWPQATSAVRAQTPDFVFMAEVYWDLEWTLMQQGFDYAYDKRLYDRLHAGDARAVRDHLRAGLDYQDRLARFLENHDEPRAAATFAGPKHQASAVVTYLAPGLRFFHQGQLEGRLKRISPHLVRGPQEPLDASVQGMYQGLLELIRQPVFRDGSWQLLECAPAWDGNGSHEAFLVYGWEGAASSRYVAAVNFADHASQCHVRLNFGGLSGGLWRLEDPLSGERYDWHGRDLTGRGLYLDMRPWQACVFRLQALAGS